MNPCAGRRIDPFDLHDAQPLDIGRGFAQRKAFRLLRLNPVDVHRQIPGNRPVGQDLRRLYLCVLDAVDIDFHGGVTVTEIGRDGGISRRLDQAGRDDVLTRVLLHEVEAGREIDRPLHRHVLQQSLRKNVTDLSLPLPDIDNRDAVQPPPIGGLTAPFGVEGRPVQDNDPVIPLLLLVYQSGLKALHSGVLIVQLLRHDSVH